MNRFTSAVGCLGLVLAGVARTAASEPEAAGIEFFERHIRPVLVERCYACHSVAGEKGVKGGLRLDAREALTKGGSSGPVLVPGEPDRSLLIQAIRYTDEDLQMPPQGKRLSAEQIAHFEAWVKLGAPYPQTTAVPAAERQAASAGHWAFRPIREPPAPEVRDQSPGVTPVDRFLLAKLEEKGLGFSTPADRRALLRRASYGLTGLPPTPDAVSAFLADSTPEAFAKVVDRLLASPQYGERWGRYWLDVARYADTKGYVFEEERRYPYAYTYRDYVIRAFNEDLPFDRFVLEQLAADHLPLGEDKRALAALGFLTLGRRFLNNPHDICDDRIDVVTRGLMGLTVSCARCHDHKYDPISIRDYYSLYGVFASCSEPEEKPLLGAASVPPEYSAYRAERTRRLDARAQYLQQREEEALAQLRAQAADYLLTAQEAAQQTDAGKQEALARERKLDPGVVRRWKMALDSWAKPPHPVFGPWVTLAALPATNFASRAGELAETFARNARSDRPLNPLVARLFTHPAPASLKDVAARYGQLFRATDQAWTKFLKEQPEAKALPNPDEEAVRQLLYAEGSPARPPRGELPRLFDTPAQQHLRKLQRDIDELDATHPGAPPRAMALADHPTPHNPRVFLRGNPGNPGPEVPRQFLEVLAGADRKPFARGSGRLELAQAIASPSNPLTARVIVNRVWQYHWGAPLVRTPSDFGLRSDPPTHPELLDYLAARFMAEGWSMKALHRRILLSRAYAQSSDAKAEAQAIDPGNRLLWRFNRQRLDFEALRDTLLAAAGSLDLTPGGRAVDLTTAPFTTRRTIYGFVDRQNLPGLFRTFDFASPDTTSPQRFHTTVPQQALFLMNSPFLMKQAKDVAERAEVKAAATDEARIRALYRLVLQREPETAEVELATAFLRRQAQFKREPAPPIWEYGYGALDEAGQRVERFTPLPHFSNYAWQGGPTLPDPKVGWVLLNAEGGHPGGDARHAAIRRWRAPCDGAVRIRGELAHPSEQGDGVRGRLVSSRAGLLGEWVARHGKAATEVDSVPVRRGEFLDFVTDCRANEHFDGFQWAPVITLVGDANQLASDTRRQWDARAEFGGPPPAPSERLTPWQQYAQVMLLSNELMFVD